MEEGRRTESQRGGEALDRKENIFSSFKEEKKSQFVRGTGWREMGAGEGGEGGKEAKEQISLTY